MFFLNRLIKSHAPFSSALEVGCKSYLANIPEYTARKQSFAILRYTLQGHGFPVGYALIVPLYAMQIMAPQAVDRIEDCVLSLTHSNKLLFPVKVIKIILLLHIQRTVMVTERYVAAPFNIGSN